MAETDPRPTATDLFAQGWTACSCGDWHRPGVACPDGGIASP